MSEFATKYERQMAETGEDVRRTIDGIADVLKFLIEATVSQPALNGALDMLQRSAADAATKLDAAIGIKPEGS